MILDIRNKNVFDIEDLFIDELLVTSESRTLNFLNSETFIGRRKKKIIKKLKIN